MANYKKSKLSKFDFQSRSGEDANDYVEIPKAKVPGSAARPSNLDEIVGVFSWLVNKFPTFLGEVVSFLSKHIFRQVVPIEQQFHSSSYSRDTIYMVTLYSTYPDYKGNKSSYRGVGYMNFELNLQTTESRSKHAISLLISKLRSKHATVFLLRTTKSGSKHAISTDLQQAAIRRIMSLYQTSVFPVQGGQPNELQQTYLLRPTKTVLFIHKEFLSHGRGSEHLNYYHDTSSHFVVFR